MLRALGPASTSASASKRPPSKSVFAKTLRVLSRVLEERSSNPRAVAQPARTNQPRIGTVAAIFKFLPERKSRRAMHLGGPVVRDRGQNSEIAERGEPIVTRVLSSSDRTQQLGWENDQGPVAWRPGLSASPQESRER